MSRRVIGKKRVFTLQLNPTMWVNNEGCSFGGPPTFLGWTANFNLARHFDTYEQAIEHRNNSRFFSESVVVDGEIYIFEEVNDGQRGSN